MRRNHRHLPIRGAILLVLAVLALWNTGRAAGPSVTATLDTDRFSADQTATLTVTVRGGMPSRPELPQVDGLRFVYIGQANRMESINGRASSTISFLYQVLAEKPGRYTIEPIRVGVAGQTLASRPLQCTVLPSAGSAAGAASGNGGGSAPATGATRLRSGEADSIGFMRIIPEKSSSYSGELVPFTIKAYFRHGLGVTVKSQPRVIGDAFVLKLQDRRPDQEEEVVNNISYTVLTWHGTLAGIKAGTFPLEVELDTSLLVRKPVQRPQSLFGSSFFNDPFFDDFFGTLTRKDVRLVSPRRSLTIRDLPTNGRPADFHGAVGSFSLAVTATPTSTMVGDPVTLKMQVSGTGDFGRVQSPVFTAKAGWKTYPPSNRFTDLGNGRGKKVFTMAIIPTTAEIDEIPPVIFSFFDPDAGRYTTLRSDPIPLQVEGGTGSQTPQMPPVARPPSPAGKGQSLPTGAVPGLAPLHTGPGDLQAAIIPLYRKTWFLAVCGLSFLVLLAALFMRLRRSQWRRNPRKRERRAREELARQVAAMEKAAMDNDRGRFLEIARRTIQDRAGLAWHREPRSITASDLARRLPADSSLVKVFAMAEHAGYSGTPPDAHDLRELLNKIRIELEGLL